MKKPTAPLPIQGSDVRGLSRLAVDATVGVTDLVEAVHRTIASTVGLKGDASAGRTKGLTGAVYRAVRGTTRVVGRGLDAALALVPAAPAEGPPSPQREAVIAALNGVWGDHLAETGNPLAIPMRWRVAGRAVADPAAATPQPSGKLLVLVHGLCMNDLQWARQGHDHGQALAQALGCTPIYLHYNSGRHVSENGRELAALMEPLVANWPVPVQDLVILTHSMGGLVARSACWQAAQEGQRWLASLRSLVFLGTPHHGAPLERGGRWIDTLLELSPFVAPFARLGKARSAGITDLRFGNVQDADWQGRDRHTQTTDDRRSTPLPAGVRVFAVAATRAERSNRIHSQLLGDGLVPVTSALGEHANPALDLHLPPEQQCVVTHCDHWGLLNHPKVTAQLRNWLQAPTASPP